MFSSDNDQGATKMYTVDELIRELNDVSAGGGGHLPVLIEDADTRWLLPFHVCVGLLATRDSDYSMSRPHIRFVADYADTGSHY